jgi:outer membrane protein, heavy metal efflux system
VAAAVLLGQAEELVAWLELHNGDVRAAAQRVRQARADLGAARLIANPSLSVSWSDITVGATNPPGLSSAQTPIYAGALSQSVEIGKRGPRIASATRKFEAARETYFDAVADMVAEARAALGRVAYLQARQVALEGSLDGARQILDLERSRLDNGDLAGNEYDRLLVDTTVLETEVAQNRTDYGAARAACAAILSAECDSAEGDIGLLDTAAVLAPAATEGDELALRPDVRALELAESSARLEAVLARRRIIPDPSFSVGYTRDLLTISGDQPRTLQFGVSLPLPLFDRGQHDAARAEAHADELRESAAALRARARGDITALRERRGELGGVLGRLRDEALPRSQRVLDSAVIGVNHGELSMTDLLLARRTHTDVVLKVMELELAVLEAGNQLRHALGLDGDIARRTEAK